MAWLFVSVFPAGAQPPAGVPTPGSPTPTAQSPATPPGGAGKAPPGAAGQAPPGGTGGGLQPGQVQPLVPGQIGAPAAAAQSGPVSLDFTSALQRARGYNQQFLTAGIAAQTAHEDRVQARAALFPSLNLLNQYIYTQGNGTPSGVFVANDGVHIYNEQALVHAELFSLTRRAQYRQAIAAEAAARARQEIAIRGLTATVVTSYYGLITAQRHVTNAARSADEARKFVDFTQKQEQGGEVAHADVVKAQITLRQRERDLAEAQLAVEKAKVALGVILFSDIAQKYNIADDLASPSQLPPLDEIERKALATSPDLRAAQAAQQAAQQGVGVARGAFYPSLVVDYFYGIDANVLGIHGPDHRQNLGSVVQGTVTVPVWNWGATRSKIRQAELLQRQAQLEAQFAQRALLSNLRTYYLEAETARSEIESLRASMNLSEESLRLTLLRYQAGEGTALEVVDAQTTLALARNAYDDGLARYRIALGTLQTLAGTF